MRAIAKTLLEMLSNADQRQHFTLQEIAPLHAAVARIAQRERLKDDEYKRRYATGRAAAMSRLPRAASG